MERDFLLPLSNLDHRQVGTGRGQGGEDNGRVHKVCKVCKVRKVESGDIIIIPSLGEG